jgi:hypothetical protein
MKEAGVRLRIVMSEAPVSEKIRPTSGVVLVAAIAAVRLLLHVLTNGNYGIFRDEFYYLECARHLDWGYVDHPPFSIWLLAGVRALLGDSVHAIRLLSELAGAATVIVTALIAREMGGDRQAQVVTALCVALAPGLLGLTDFFSMNAFDILFWSILALILAKISRRDDPSLWLWFGLVAGLGLMNKISILFLGFGVVVSLPFTHLRRHFGCWQLLAGAGLAVALFLPYVRWNAAQGWPTLEFMANATRFKIASLTPIEFAIEQLIGMAPQLVPVWIAGLLWLLLPGRGWRFRMLGLSFVAVFVLMAALKTKSYYLSPAYPMLFAAGGCAAEAASRRWGKRWPIIVLIVWIVVSSSVVLPFAIPILSPKAFLDYQEMLGVKPAHHETSEIGELPQHFADRFGWENMTSIVASVYETLPNEEKARCLIVTSNYGESSAINYFGSEYGLPVAVSGHNNAYLWGPGITDPAVVIYIGGSRERLELFFEEVEVAAVVRSEYAMPYETNLPVHVCRTLKVPLDEAWRANKLFI